MQGAPSTAQRTSPSCRSVIAVTMPRRRLSAIARDLDERQRHVHHPFEVLDRDALVGRVDVDHPVREIDALETALIEDVRVGAAATQAVAGLEARARERSRGESNGFLVAAKAVAAGARVDRGLDVALAELRCESDRFQHL